MLYHPTYEKDRCGMIPLQDTNSCDVLALPNKPRSLSTKVKHQEGLELLSESGSSAPEVCICTWDNKPIPAAVEVENGNLEAIPRF